MHQKHAARFQKRPLIQWTRLATLSGAGTAALVLATALSLPLPASASASAATATSNRVTNTKYGFTFKLPVGWREVPLNSKDLSAILGQAAKASPSLKKSLTDQVQGAASKGLKVFAFSSIPEGGNFFPNLNVGVYNSAPSLSAIDAQAKIELTSSGGTAITTKSVHLALGPALQASYTLPLSTTTIYGTQDYVVHGGRTYIITFSATEKPVEANAAMTTMTSWRFKSKH
jgi:hypothetical protein